MKELPLTVAEFMVLGNDQKGSNLRSILTIETARYIDELDLR